MDVLTKARDYLAGLESPRRSKSDAQDSHAVVFHAAASLIGGFDLSEDTARRLLEDYCSRSDKPWSPAEIDHKISDAVRASSGKRRGYLIEGRASGKRDDGVASLPSKQDPARPVIDHAAIRKCTLGLPSIDAAWLSRRSALAVGEMTSGDFLNALYRPDERILIFTSQFSQGDFLWWVGKGGYRLAQRLDVRGMRSVLPSGGREGVWFLTQPVTGKWEVNHSPAGDGVNKYTRRSFSNVTSWRYFVLESDELDEGTWLKVLASLPLPIAAIYTSGGRSVHALVKCEVPTKAVWDAIRNNIRAIVCPLGADPAALTAVRLSRLPGCKRGGKLQRLIYLNPNPDETAICLKPEVRE